MFKFAVPPDTGFGHGWVDSIEISESTLNLLFAALLVAASGAFIGGNLLLLDATVFQRSGQIALACLAVLLIFYTLARSLGSLTWGLMLTYALIWAMTYGRQPWLVVLVYACAACGFLYTARFLRVARCHWGAVLLMGVIGAATAFAHFWPPSSFDTLPRLHVGDLHKDTLFHAAIAAMIKNYGVASTGLHGLVETPYHALSHTLMAGLSRLSGCGTLEVYGVARPVLFIPILVFSVVACGAMLDRGGRPSVPIAWGLVCVLLVESPRLLSPWLFWSLYFGSESYLISLGPFLLGLPLLFKARLGVPDLLLVLLSAALMANAKLSVGVIYAGLWLTRLIFVPAERPVFERIATLAVVVAAAFAAVKPVDGMEWDVISPLHFIRVSSPFGSWLSEAGAAVLAGSDVSWHVLALALIVTLSFFAFHFLFSWILIGWVAYNQGMAGLLKDPVALYSLAAVIAGTMAVLLLFIPSGSVYYFSNPAFFTALPVIVTLATRQVGHRRVTGTAVLAVGILIILVSSLRDYYWASALSPSRVSRQQSPFIESLLRIRDEWPINVVIKADPAAVVTNNPARLHHCTAIPFVFPAVSERPWMDVIPVRDDCRYFDWGYAQYGFTRSHQALTVKKPRLVPGMTIHHWPAVPGFVPQPSLRAPNY